MTCRYVVLSVLLMVLLNPSLPAAEPLAPPAWQASFEELCAGTVDAMRLDEAQLGALLERCSELEGEIAGLDATRAKVYRKRLDLACNLYRFVLEEKRAKRE